MELFQAHQQWKSRPADERFLSLASLAEHVRTQRQQSAQRVVANRGLEVLPLADDPTFSALAIRGPSGNVVAPTHHAFNQLATLTGAPASYLRKLPSPLAADCLNHGLKTREIEEVGVLLRQNGSATLNAVTGPNYGRIWNTQVADALVNRFGDGLTGDFRIPGEFGSSVVITPETTTLYAGDRDMWVFLADEEHRIEVPNRRNGQPGSLARGIFVWNSEVGAATLGMATFLFDYMCCNHIVWGATEFNEVRIRHTSGAPHRWIEHAMPTIQKYANSSAAGLESTIQLAQARTLGKEDAVAAFLAKRYTAKQAEYISLAHMAEEGRPIETLWDAVTGATAFAKSIPNMDDRVKVERIAGDMLKLAS